MAAEPLVEEFEQFIPRLVPQSEPPQDPDAHYPGQGAVQLWNDVWHYGKSIVNYFGRSRGGASYVLSTTLDEAIDGAIGATIKSLSGYINRAAQIGLDAQQWSSMELDAMSSNIGAIYQYFDDHVKFLERAVVQIEQNELPAVRESVAQLRHDMLAGFAFNSAADRGWAVDNILHPLEETIFNVAADVPVQAEHAYERAKLYTDDAVNALGLRTLAAFAPVHLAISALQKESEDCTQPMCEAMGPKTDLGKLLKGLKVAEWAALLATIAAARETDIDGALTFLSHQAGHYISTFEDTFVTGGGTIGQTVADLVG